MGTIGPEIAALLRKTNDLAGFSTSLVCTDAGLLVASEGDDSDEDHLAGLTSLFDDIVIRADRDVGMSRIDEVALLDPTWGRCVIRPIPTNASFGRLFLVVRLGPKSTWRRYTNRLLRGITRSIEDAS